MDTYKRAAPDSASDEPEAKKPAASGCSWGTGGGGGFGAVAASGAGGCSWGGGAATSFASIASSGTGCSWGGGGGGGFASVAASGGEGFAAATTFAPNPVGGTGEKPRAASAATSASETEAPSTVEAAQTGEEDEICVYRVRAKLFRLEVRMEPKRKPEDEPKKSNADEAAAAAAEDKAEGTGESAAEATAAKDSKLNPEAEPFVPAGSPAASSKPKDDKPEKSDDDDDDDDADEKPAQPEEPTAPEELVETTRWAERGIGQLRLLVHKNAPESGVNPRVVMRQEHVGRLILNESLLPTTAPAARVSDTSIRLVLVDSTSTSPQSYLLRVKTPAEGSALLKGINDTIPSK